MKKILVASVVLGIVAVVANAALTTTCVKTATYSVTTGSSVVKVVDVYTLTANMTDGNVSAYWAYAKNISDNYPNNLGQGMFQVWHDDPNLDEDFLFIGWKPTLKTPTMTNALKLASVQRNAETHFLHSDNQYLATTETPNETNNEVFGVITSGEAARRHFGLSVNTIDIGSDPNKQDLAFAGTCALKTEYMFGSCNFMQVGVVGLTPGTSSNWVLHVWGEVGGTGSVVTGYDYYWIPEPATMVLLGLGALPLLRRRRR